MLQDPHQVGTTSLEMAFLYQAIQANLVYETEVLRIMDLPSHGSLRMSKHSA
jgi:hypothetical protein